MLKSFAVPTFALGVLLFCPFAYSQAAPQEPARRPDESRPAFTLDNRRDGWGRPVKPAVKGQKSDPAPVHDISGIWDPGEPAIRAICLSAMPEARQPQHRPA